MNPQLIEYLEELQDLHRTAHLRFFGDNGGVISLTAKITGLTTNGPEPGFLADGTIRIPLARLISVDEHKATAVS